MSDYIIKVENLGKKFKIRHQLENQRYVALRDVIAAKAGAPLRWLRQQDAGSPRAQLTKTVIPIGLRMKPKWAIANLRWKEL